MSNTDRIGIVALEKDVKELQKGVGQLLVQLQATNKFLKNTMNYLTTKSVIEHHGDKEEVIAEMRLLYNDISDQEFDKMVLPSIDARIDIYNKQLKEATENK